MLMYALGICISSGMTFSEAGLHGACSLGAALGVPAGVGTHLIISAARCLPSFGILQPRVPTTNHLWISPLSCFTATDSALPAHGVLQLQKDKGTPLTSPKALNTISKPCYQKKTKEMDFSSEELPSTSLSTSKKDQDDTQMHPDMKKAEVEEEEGTAAERLRS
ncbi:hypothetical protein OJAV_G00102800 [Oryzias javanicus]|uniref:Uncharacterized protein n=1 Tax=Oryzias javanicus TaxID=123683 RepID=A0A437CXL3_ORYJA|nr:hypothetical protein OJAV_G00102800 [Oryzias javanicus]